VSAGGLSEHALFEIADVAAAAGLAERLARRWDVFVTLEGTDTVGVRAVLPREPEDVAALLREVEAWVEEESLFALRFELDGRAYVLQSGEAAWSIDASYAVESSGQRVAQHTKAVGTVDRAMSASRIRGLEDLRDDIVLALRLEDESP